MQQVPQKLETGKIEMIAANQYIVKESWNYNTANKRFTVWYSLKGLDTIKRCTCKIPCESPAYTGLKVIDKVKVFEWTDSGVGVWVNIGA